MTTAFVFPGQGSHREGAAAAWEGHPAHAIFDELGEVTGLDLAALANDAGTGEKTAHAQPAIFAASLAAFRALTEAGARPDLVAGHSLGEATAAVAAGVFSAQDGARLVAARGRAMGDACAANPGTMAAVIRVADDDLDAIVADIDGAEIANQNAPGQVVVSGPPEAIDAVADAAKEAGGRVIPLEVEGAFHSAAMAPAVAPVEAILGELDARDPEVPLVTGTSGKELTTADEVTRALADGILSPVRWTAVQSTLVDRGVDVVVEVGPGGVLKGLAKRAMPDVEVLTVETPDDVAAVLERLGARSAPHD